MRKPRTNSSDGLEAKMLAAMRPKVGPDGRITAKVAGEIAAHLTLKHFRRAQDTEPLTPQEIAAGKICGKNAMCEINNAFVTETPPGEIRSADFPPEPPPLRSWTICPKNTCHRHQRCQYLNAPWCPLKEQTP